MRSIAAAGRAICFGAALAVAGGAMAQPEPSGADAGKGEGPRPLPRDARQEPAPTPPPPEPSAAAEKERGAPAPPPAETGPVLGAPAPRSPAEPGDKDKSPSDKHGPTKPKVTAGAVAETGGGIAGSLLAKGVGVAVGGPIGGLAAGWVGGKLGSGAVHVVRRLFSHGRKPEPLSVAQVAPQAAPQPAFDPGPLLEVPPSY